MWSYYGAKTNIIKSYPVPKHKKIIEPFAGSARYALEYFENDIIIMDKYDIVARVWKFLQKCSPADIRSLQIPEPNKTTDNYEYDCQEAKWLVGFIISFATFYPCKKVSLHFRERFWEPCCLQHNLEFETNPELSKKYQLSKIHNGKKLTK